MGGWGCDCGLAVLSKWTRTYTTFAYLEIFLQNVVRPLDCVTGAEGRNLV